MVYRSPRSKLRHTLALWGVLIAFCVSLASPIAASAAPSDSASSDDYMKAWEYATFLRACFNSHGKDNERRTISSPQNAIGYVWFNVNDVDVGYSVPTDNGIKQCGQMDHVREALATIGYPVDQAGAIKVLCGVMEYQTGSPSTTCSQDPAVFATQTSFEPKSISELNILAYRLYSPYFGINNVPPLRDEHKYVGYYNAFVKGPCKAQDQGLFNPQDVAMASLASQSGYAKIDVAVSGKTETHLFKYSDGTAVLWTHERTFDKVTASCGDLGGLIGSRAEMYAQKNPSKTNPDIGGGSVNTPPAGASATSTCAVNGVGWIVCPVMNFLGGLMDNMVKFLGDNFLRTEPELLKADKTNGTYVAWDIFRNYANIAFVIAFMFIIYSQITGAGISNYGLKRMLPRLIVAAILVNISYFVCQLAVDVSNMLGYSITEMFNGIAASTVPSGAPTTSFGSGGWEKVIGTVLVGGIGIALALALGILVPALLAALMVVLILLVRKAVIILLIVVSPLAFVAYLLPNTEQWFKKWYSMLGKLLMVFPVVAGIFGASKLAATILENIGTGAKDDTLKLLALGVSVVPLFIVPSTLKGALAATGALGAKMQGWGNKATARVGAKSKEGYLGRQLAERKKIAAATNAQITGGTYKGKNPLRRGRSAVFGAMNRSKVTGKAGDRMSALGAAVAQKDMNEEVDNEVARMSSQWEPHNELEEAGRAYREALHANDVVKARAAQKILLGKGNAGLAKIREGVASTDSMSPEQRQGSKAIAYARGDLSAAGIKGKDAALNAWSYDSRSESLGAHDARGSTYDGLTDVELAGQSAESLERAISAGGLSAERAAGMQANDNVWQNLSEDKRRVIIGAQTRTRDVNEAHDEALVQDSLYNMNNRNNSP